MAGKSTEPESPKKNEKFDQFYTEVKEIEKRDSVLTSKQQIDRLLRPGASYFNLNPYEVLQLDHDTPLDEAKKKYKRLSILVHPDKNQDDLERANNAFETVNRAWRTIDNDESRKKCQEIIQEAKDMTEFMVVEKRKKLKKEGKDTKVEEDDPSIMKRSIYVQTCKLFADLERKRKDHEARELQERKRKREQEIDEEQKATVSKEWQKNFDESRESRVNSWKAFQESTKKSSKKIKIFKPPKHKAESR
ncbi:dnaJ homolog subfamily C member 8 [Myzus persicae]|uniref:dnaJ homolog subfamily C member 8 n=1 Tax=Myzus persicae TaxID=13164 RepID=UPI000B936253|nr:dnaJ homolog subfamily C member 8 [Myzus persicae]XP_022171783.1 dnaJ homolog subfamily C member 8 [Myzus persicae]WOX63138.1 dnaJ-like protein subfamily C member 8 [Myzus persicae]